MIKLKVQKNLGARKIPRASLAALLVHSVTLGVAAAQAQNVDSAGLLRQARRAEADYEFSIRRFAPVRPSAFDGRRCDEQVGRYCVIYDTGQEALPPEPARVVTARDSAVARLSRAFPRMPGNRRVAYPLVRLLVLAGRATEALNVARAYAEANADPDAHMLLGYALHAARHTEEALAEFTAWQALLPERQREHLIDIRWLLSPSERRRFEKLPAADRDAYRARAWRFADPLYLTPGNELLGDHYARHALARILAVRPVVLGAESWGPDVEELTVRFGVPVRTTRGLSTGSLGASPSYSEQWDPAERTYFPPDEASMAAGLRVDTIWPIDSLTTRSGHAPPTIRLMRPLEHQALSFPGNRLLVVGSVRLDSAARSHAQPLGRVFVQDSLFVIVGEADAEVQAFQDSLTFRAELGLPAGTRFYSAELLDSATLFAARARYPLAPPAAMPPLAISGLLLCQPFATGALPTGRHDDRLRPLSRPVLQRGAQFGVYAEIVTSAPNRRAIQLELETRSVDRPWAVARLGAWIGSKLGIAAASRSARVSWVMELEPGMATPVALTVDAGSLPPGKYEVVLRAQDSVASALVTAERKFLVIAGAATGSGRL